VRDQMHNFLQHGHVVDLELRLDLSGLHLGREALDLRARVGQQVLASMEKEQDETHVQRAHLRAQQRRGQPFVRRQPHAAAGRQLDDGVRLGAQTGMDIAIELDVHRVAPSTIACVDMQNRWTRSPGRDALSDDLVRLLWEVWRVTLSMKAAGKGACDDRLVGGGHVGSGDQEDTSLRARSRKGF
jgi:hypothetical protein